VPIDWSQPVEFDDGSPVTRVEAMPGGETAVVTAIGHPSRRREEIGYNPRQSYSYRYYTATGIFCGGDKKQYRFIRNVDLAHTFIPEEWS
jgi:hypothetical protein